MMTSGKASPHVADRAAAAVAKAQSEAGSLQDQMVGGDPEVNGLNATALGLLRSCRPDYLTRPGD
jgi:hypothetical protein